MQKVVEGIHPFQTHVFRSHRDPSVKLEPAPARRLAARHAI